MPGLAQQNAMALAIMVPANTAPKVSPAVSPYATYADPRVTEEMEIPFANLQHFESAFQ